MCRVVGRYLLNEKRNRAQKLFEDLEAMSAQLLLSESFFALETYVSRKTTHNKPECMKFGVN